MRRYASGTGWSSSLSYFASPGQFPVRRQCSVRCVGTGELLHGSSLSAQILELVIREFGSIETLQAFIFNSSSINAEIISRHPSTTCIGNLLVYFSVSFSLRISSICKQSTSFFLLSNSGYSSKRLLSIVYGRVNLRWSRSEYFRF